MKVATTLATLLCLLGGSVVSDKAAARPFQVPVGRLALRPIPGTQVPESGFAAYFFAVPISVGWTHLNALLDTGSIGVRVLPDQLRPRDIVSSGNHPETEAFGGSTVLDGVAAKARVGLGPFTLLPLVTLQLIRSGRCAPLPGSPGQTKPCPLDTERFDQFRFGGEGRPYVGFPAIFGVRAQQPGPQSEVYNPLNRTANDRYIIDLNRTARDPGRLLVDPNQFQAQGFVSLTHDPAAQNATVRGCLVPPNGGAEICGPMLFDSGAPNISVTPHAVSACLPSGATASPCFPNGSRATIRFVDATGATLARETFTVGSEPYAQIKVDQPASGLGDAYISLGQVPFMAFSVLIDAQSQTLGIRTRPNPPRGGQTGTTGG